jgi:hypothetical protein
MASEEQKREISWPEALSVRTAIQREKRVSFNVVSGSMEPLIMTGSQIDVAPVVALDELRVFDILLFWNGRLLICHYLWHINAIPNADGSRTVVTRPLAFNGEDLPVPEDHILGKIVSHKISFWRKLKIILGKRANDARTGILS